MKKKGFTLIELIAVIVIMGLLLLIVIPATTRLMKGNKNKKYDEYYNLIEKAALLYADSRKDDLGGVNASGCIDTSVEFLVKNKYLKEFDEDGVTCNGASSYDLTNFEDIDSSKNYIDVRIRNVNGKKTVESSLVCVKRNKVEYSKLKENTESCDKYVAERENVLYDKISSLSATGADSNADRYIIGNTSDNYVYYSGKMWRIVSYNDNNKTVKLISDEVVTVLPFNDASSNFNNSNVDIWLNNTFLKTLRNPDYYLLNANWNYSLVANSDMPNSSNVTQSRVGLLNYYEYDKSKEFLNSDYSWWLISKASESSNWYISNNSPVSASVNTYVGIRPSIVLNPNITYAYGGEGTKDNPYRLIGESTALTGTLLNTRYAGEYVKFAGELYRITNTTTNYTRLVKVTVIPNLNTVFDETITPTYNQGATIGKLLNTEWYGNLSQDDSKKLVVGDFCVSIVTPTTKYSFTCDNSNILNIKIGIPKIGDMYTIGSNQEYWTLSNSGTETLNVVDTSGNISSKNIKDTSYVRPVISIASNTVIASGTGTSSDPYVLK